MKLFAYIFTSAVAFVASASVAGACSIAPPNTDLITEKMQDVAEATLTMNDRVIDLIIEPKMEFNTQYIAPGGMCPDAIIYSEEFAVRYKVDDAFGAMQKTYCTGLVTVTFNEDWTEANAHTFKVEGTNAMRCTR